MQPNPLEQAVSTIQQAEVVAFDWDGTLIDSVPYKLAQNQAIAREFRNDLTIEQVRQVWNSSAGFSELMQKLCQTNDMEAIMTAVMRDYDKPEYAKRQFDFTPKLLRAIRARGKKTALITNATREILTADTDIAELTPLESFFDYTQASNEFTHKKPDPRVFIPMLKNLGALPRQVVYIGDEFKDYQAAHDAGMKFIGIHGNTSMASEQEFRDVGALSISSLGDLSLGPRA